MEDYCDTNILTGAVNKQNLTKKLGKRGFEKYGENITGFRSSGESKLKNVDKCLISKGALISDLGNHLPSVGAVLTSSHIKNIDIVNVKKGFKTGSKYYNKACAISEKDSSFYNKFCSDNKLKTELKFSDRNDVTHFGSAVRLGSKKFITANEKDFKELEKVSDIKIE